MRSTSCVKDDQFYLELVEKLGFCLLHDVLGVIRLHSDKSFLVRTIGRGSGNCCLLT